MAPSPEIISEMICDSRAGDEQEVITRSVRALMVQRGTESSDLVTTTFTGDWG